MQRIFILHKTTKLILAADVEREATSFQRLWEPPGNGYLLQIPETGDIRGRRRLNGGSEELVLNFFYCIGLLQLVEDRSGVKIYDEDIIGVRYDIIVASLAPHNPDIRVKKSWIKTH